MNEAIHGSKEGEIGAATLGDESCWCRTVARLLSAGDKKNSILEGGRYGRPYEITS